MLFRYRYTLRKTTITFSGPYTKQNKNSKVPPSAALLWMFFKSPKWTRQIITTCRINLKVQNDPARGLRILKVYSWVTAPNFLYPASLRPKTLRVALKRTLKGTISGNVGAFIIRMGFGGILNYRYHKEPQNPILIIKAPTLRVYMPCPPKVSTLSSAWWEVLFGASSPAKSICMGRAYEWGLYYYN